MNKKLLVIDLDGTTLVKSYKVSKNNINAINKVLENNIDVLIATGRGPTRIRKVYKNLNMHKYNFPIICFNGAGIYDYKKDNFIRILKINVEDSKRIFNLAKKYKASIWGYSENNKDIYYFGKPSITRSILLIFYKLNNYKFKEKKFNSNIIKFSFLCNSKNAPHFIKELEKINLKLFRHVFNATKKYLWDISLIQSDKYEAIQWYSKINNINNENIISIGDGENDINMIKNSGLGIAMENSVDEVKKVANVITGNVKKDGLSEAINKYILN